MTKIYFSLTLLLISFAQIGAQNNQLSRFHLDLTAGMAVGAPISKLSDKPEGATGTPGIMATGGFIVAYDAKDDLTINFGIQYAHKGMKFSSPSSGKYDIARAILGENFPIPLNMNYDGQITGKFANEYLDFPLYLSYGREQWRLLIGYQYSKLLNAHFKGEADITAVFEILKFRDQPWDESARIAADDHALILGTEYEFGDIFSLGTQLNYGLKKIYTEETEDFTSPRNVYLKFLLKFRLF